MTDLGEAPSRTLGEGEDRTANAARGGVLTAVGSGLSMAFSLAIIILVTRTYGAEGAGVFFGVVALFTLAGTTAKLGAETGLVYSISRSRAAGRDEEVVPTIRLALLPPLVVAVLFAVLALVAAPALARWLTDPASADDYALVVRGVALALPAFVAVHVLSGATRGLGRMRPTVYGINIGRPALQLVPMVAVAGAGLGLGALGLAWALPMVVTAVLMYAWLSRLLEEGDITKREPASRPGRSRQFWSYAAPRGVANTLQIAQDRSGVLLLGALATASSAGLFVTVARLIGALRLFTYAVGQALNPQLSALIALGDRDGANRLLQQISAWTALPILPVGVGLLVFPEAALSVFGDDFEQGALALSILAATTLLTAFLSHTDNVLLMGGRSRTSLLNVSFSLVVTVTGLILLIPAHGVEGAAVAWSLGMLAYALVPLWFGWRQLRLQPFGAEAANVAVAVLPCLALSGLGRLVLGSSLPAAAVSCTAGLIGYLAVLHRRRDQVGLPALVAVFRDRRGAV